MRLSLFKSRLTERNQHRLLWMNGQTETTKTLRQDVHNPSGIFFQFKADNEIISKANQETSAPHPGVDILYKPTIQYMMQEYVT